MQNHIKLLIVGGIIIGSSIGLFFLAYGLFGIPTANTPVKINPITSSEPLILVADLDKEQEASILAKDILSKKIQLNVQVKDPNGAVVFDRDFDSKLLTSFIPTTTGPHTMVVMSLDDDGTTVEAAFGHPFVVERMDNVIKAGDVLGPEFELYSYAGLGIFVGLIIVIIGAIKLAIFKVKSRRTI